MLLGVILDRLADVAERSIGSDSFDAEPYALFGCTDESTIFLAHIADEESCIGVTMHSVEEARDVEVDDVPILENRRVRNAMTDHLIERRAHTLGIPVVIQRTRVRTVLDDQFVDEDIDVVGGDSGANELTCLAENFGSKGTRFSHSCDDIG